MTSPTHARPPLRELAPPRPPVLPLQRRDRRIGFLAVAIVIALDWIARSATRFLSDGATIGAVAFALGALALAAFVGVEITGGSRAPVLAMFALCAFVPIAMIALGHSEYGADSLATGARSLIETPADAAEVRTSPDPWIPVFMCEAAGDPAAIGLNGKYRGAFQFDQPTWDETAQRAGRPHLIGRDPATFSYQTQRAQAETLRGYGTLSRWPECGQHYAACFQQTGGPLWCYEAAATAATDRNKTGERLDVKRTALAPSFTG